MLRTKSDNKLTRRPDGALADVFRPVDVDEVFARIDSLTHEDVLPGDSGHPNWRRHYSEHVPMYEVDPPEVVDAEAEYGSSQMRVWSGVC